MDKRFKKLTPNEQAIQKDALYGRILKNELTIGQAIKELRTLAQLTQPEFAKHRGISLDSLRQIESGIGNPTVQTLNKVLSIFQFKVGLVRSNG